MHFYDAILTRSDWRKNFKDVNNAERTRKKNQKRGKKSHKFAKPEVKKRVRNFGKSAKKQIIKNSAKSATFDSLEKIEPFAMRENGSRADYTRPENLIRVIPRYASFSYQPSKWANTPLRPLHYRVFQILWFFY